MGQIGLIGHRTPEAGRREDRREAERPEGGQEGGPEGDGESGETGGAEPCRTLTLQDGQGLQDKEKVIKEKEAKRKL